MHSVLSNAFWYEKHTLFSDHTGTGLVIARFGCPPIMCWAGALSGRLWMHREKKSRRSAHAYFIAQWVINFLSDRSTQFTWMIYLHLFIQKLNHGHLLTVFICIYSYSIPLLYLDLCVLGSCRIVRWHVRYCCTVGTRSISLHLQCHLLIMCMWPIKFEGTVVAASRDILLSLLSCPFLLFSLPNNVCTMFCAATMCTKLLSLGLSLCSVVVSLLSWCVFCHIYFYPSPRPSRPFAFW